MSNEIIFLKRVQAGTAIELDESDNDYNLAKQLEKKGLVKIYRAEETNKITVLLTSLGRNLLRSH